VSGATDAARAAADLVLTEPGLMVISHAIEEARRIFGRLKSYAMYRISETYRLLLFLLASMIVFEEHPLSAIMIILIALLNDIPIMMIAYDHMEISPKPIAWNMKEVMIIAVGLAVVGVVSTFGLYWIGDRIWLLTAPQCRTLAFMAILCGGNLTIYITRNRGFLFEKPLPEYKFFLATMFTQVVGTLIAVYGFGTDDMRGIGWTHALYAWGYILIWFVLCILSKMLMYVFVEGSKKEHALEQEILLDISSLHVKGPVHLRVVVEREKKKS
jgi:H+-transporting ATPase